MKHNFTALHSGAVFTSQFMGVSQQDGKLCCRQTRVVFEGVVLVIKLRITSWICYLQKKGELFVCKYKKGLYGKFQFMQFWRNRNTLLGIIGLEVKNKFIFIGTKRFVKNSEWQGTSQRRKIKLTAKKTNKGKVQKKVKHHPNSHC